MLFFFSKLEFVFRLRAVNEIMVPQLESKATVQSHVLILNYLRFHNIWHFSAVSNEKYLS
jgi:hypothetical protein